MEWIKCNNAMPQDRVRVLCKMSDGSSEVLAHVPAYKGEKYPHDPHWIGRGASYMIFTAHENKVTHWMPLPSPPAD